MEKKLNESYEELSEANVELAAYVEQLTASEEELRIQYDRIIESEKKLSKSEEKSRNIIKAMPDLLFILNHEGRFLDCEANDENILIMPKKVFIGKTIWEVMPKEIAEMAYERMELLLKGGGLQSFEYKLKIKDRERYYELRMVQNSKEEVLAISRDISEQKQMEQKLEYLSYHDQLTGLYNRRFFKEELKRLDMEGNLPLSIVMGDVNGLKLINDSFGHIIGDELLKKVAEVIRKGCRADDIIARLGGDEFVILLPKTDTYETEQIVKRIKAIALKQKVNSVNVSISFGYEAKKNKEEKVQDVLKKAEDHMYKKKLFESPSMRGKTISAIIRTLHEKNKREEQHSFRTSELCKDMGKAICLPETEIEDLRTAGLLHDIGKIAIEENILNKQERLTDEEFEEIKRHPEIGYRILSTVNDMLEISEYVLAHHERWNGTGYPKGLEREKIPLQSRIISIADSYDAMTSERSYRSPLAEEVAIQELQTNSGTQFDPELVKVFIEKVLKK
ncbi:HD domain-containing phosphohydrolase [Clostridium sp.]|uniref:HD domain-containing phosphohydrolase n=1 Tax=Clostridium sp. TaxID=1506 RepID=UPI0039E73ADF